MLYITRDSDGVSVWVYRPRWSTVNKRWESASSGHFGPFCRRGFQRATGVRIAGDWSGIHAIRRVYFNIRLTPVPRARPKKRRG
jgi:hypothetical protein